MVKWRKERQGSDMKLKRFTAVLLIALLCLSGCKPSAEEEIMANTQQPVQQTVPQTQPPQSEQSENEPGGIGKNVGE